MLTGHTRLLPEMKKFLLWHTRNLRDIQTFPGFVAVSCEATLGKTNMKCAALHFFFFS